MALFRNLLELDELGSALREGKCLERNGVSLTPAVLQSGVKNLLPWPIQAPADEHLQLLGCHWATHHEC